MMKWINFHLKKRELKIEKFEDLSDGIGLINLYEILFDQNIGRYNKKTRMRIQKIENCHIFLLNMNKRGLKSIGIGSEG
jgi:hypothetical protein